MDLGQDTPAADAARLPALLPTGPEAVELIRLLIAADAFPRGGLFTGYYCTSAALRYECIWLKILREHGTTCVPPLDVALVWFAHRQFPVSYANSMRRRCLKLLHPPPQQAFEFSSQPAGDEWKSVAGDHPTWPPPLQGSEHDLELTAAGWLPPLSLQLGDALGRLSWQLRSWLRTHFLDESFLERARDRYWRFLKLLAENPGSILVPTADIALMWHTHLGLSDRYLQACEELLGARVGPETRCPEEGEKRPHVDAGDDGGGGGGGGGSGDISVPEPGVDGPLAGAGAGGDVAPRTPGPAAKVVVQPWRPSYLDLDLDSEELRLAYGRTACLYEQVYGEPYDSPHTAWLPLGEPHPLESPLLSPVGFALRRVFEGCPGAADIAPSPGLLAAAAAAGRRSSGALPLPTPRGFSPGGKRPSPTPSQLSSYYHNHLFQHPSPLPTSGVARRSLYPATPGLQGLPPLPLSPQGAVFSPGPQAAALAAAAGLGRGRAGGHALFAAWLAASTSCQFYDKQTCGGWCFKRSWSIREATVERMVVPLVQVAFLRNLPDTSNHPFLTAVHVRQGLWKPETGEAGADPSSGDGGGGGGDDVSARDTSEHPEAGDKGRELPSPSPLEVREEVGPVQDPADAAADAVSTEGAVIAETVITMDATAAAAAPTEHAQGAATASSAAPTATAAAEVTASVSGADGGDGGGGGGGGASDPPRARSGRSTASCSSTVGPKGHTATTTTATTTATPSCDIGEDSDGDNDDEAGGACMFSPAAASSLSLQCAEAFVDHPVMRGLAALLESRDAPHTSSQDLSHDGAGAAEGKKGSAKGSPGGGGDRSGGGSGTAAGEGVHGEAPLWRILAEPVYAQRARSYFDHLWAEAAKQRGLGAVPGAGGLPGSGPGSGGGSRW